MLFGICFWDLPAFLVLIGVCVYAGIRHYKRKKRINELENLIEE